MMHVIINLKVTITVILASVIISYGYLRMMDIGNLTTMYQTIFGGKPLNGIMLKGLFITILSLLQFITIDYIVFYLDNADSLTVRYGSKDRWLKALLNGCFMLTAGYVFFITFTWLLLDIVFNYLEIQWIDLGTVGMVGRIYLFCVIIVLIQISLLIKFTKTSAYLIMCGIMIVLALTSHNQGGVISILPQWRSPMTSFFNIIVNMLIVLILILVIRRIIHKKELVSYEN